MPEVMIGWLSLEQPIISVCSLFNHLVIGGFLIVDNFIKIGFCIRFWLV